MPSKKLTIVNGRRVLVDAKQRIRQDSDRQYNQHRQSTKSNYLSFYHSSQWQHIRRQALLRDNHICQRCGLEATLVDHIIPSEDAWDGRLDLDNLESLCKDCHYWKTKRETIKRKKGQHRYMQINIIAGYPGSGKSTYVRDHVGQHDLVYDYDALMAALTGLPLHVHNIDAHDYVSLIYELIMRKLKAEQTFDNVWIIMTYPDKRLDSLLVSRDLHHYMLSTSKDVCIQRLINDKRNIQQLTKVFNKIDELKSIGKFENFKII
ncbi:HNH endonuclease [Loigolactobacillus bifermentans]|uniref:Putative HNH nuclease YajD n=1 Tax=Loigolactobacillus bifermentans DSM 20003 TaxID=1423726 RepID=A0A0R1H4K7_9LACO|nr:HNH endonuclease [Loigolactobacillus bifermentans]KRK40905.1 phage-related terminase small subunit [Loigolactobacillus bifermentans DSM 20003]QGG59656.1 HNH endonuclease [Loigolactobacillus bifermentans]